MRSGIEIERLPGLLKRFRTIDFVARPASEFLRDWADAQREEIEDRIPIWTGETKDSFYLEIDQGAFPKWARIVSDDPRARWLEYGTGALSEDPYSSHEPYFPPPEALRDWADGHGLDAYTVAFGIFQRGGTKPTHFLSDAMEVANERLGSQLQRFGQMIEDAGDDY